MPRRSDPEMRTSTTTEERRSLIVAGAVFFGLLVVLVSLAAVLGGDDEGPPPTTTIPCEQGDDVCLAAQREQTRPGIIPEPNSGVAPREEGDRGTGAQYAVLGLIVGGLVVIVALVARSSRRARRASDDAEIDVDDTRSSSPAG